MYDMVKNICPSCFSIPEYGTCKKCGNSLDEKTSYALPVGVVLNNRYIIGEILGVGGYGITYKAMDISTNKVCAVKEYYPSEIALRNKETLFVEAKNKNRVSTYNAGLQRFYIEIQILSLMNDCAGIVDVTDYIKANNTAYMVMEFLEGMTLRKFLNKGKVTEDKKFNILVSVLKALEKVHEKGLLHRDISPENIFIKNDGNVLLIDFGAARYFVSKATRGLSVILKPGFAPPEQYSTKGNQGPWTDIYAIAATYYYMVSGKMMPDALQRLNGTRVYHLRELCSSIPEYISAAIDRATNIDPTKRFRNVSEFLDALTSKEFIEEPQSSLLIRILNVIVNVIKKAKCSLSQVKTKVTTLINIRTNVKPYINLIQEGQEYRFAMDADTPLQIGTLESCDIVILNSDISPVHCTVYYDSANRKFMVIDSSRTGTFDMRNRKFVSNAANKVKIGEKFYLSSKEYIVKVGVER